MPVFSKTAMFCFTYGKELILYYLANKFMLVAVIVYKKRRPIAVLICCQVSCFFKVLNYMISLRRSKTKYVSLPL